MKHIVLFSSLCLIIFLLTACFESHQEKGNRAGEKYCNCFRSTKAASSDNLMQLYRKVASTDSGIMKDLVQKLTDNEIAAHKKFVADMADNVSSLSTCLKKAEIYRQENSPNNNGGYEGAYQEAVDEPRCEFAYHYRMGRITRASILINKK